MSKNCILCPGTLREFRGTGAKEKDKPPPRASKANRKFSGSRN